jgi:hypothetical protein
MAFVNDFAEPCSPIRVSINTLAKHSTGHNPVFSLPSRKGWLGLDTEERIAPLMSVVNSKSSIGFDRSRNKTH